MYIHTVQSIIAITVQLLYNTTAAPSWCAQGMCSSKPLVSMSSSTGTDYASVGGAPEAYGSWFVYVCVYVYQSKEL